MFNKKRKYFRGKLKGIQKVLWDLDFKKFKTLEIREGLREEYDQMKTKVSMVKDKIKTELEKPTMSPDERKRLEDEAVLMERDLDRMVNGHPTDQSIVCLKGLDLAVFGSKPTQDHPHGVQGIDQEIQGLRELQEILKEYIKKEA